MMREVVKFIDAMGGCLEWQTKRRYVWRGKQRKKLLKATRQLLKAGSIVSDLDIIERIMEKRDMEVCVRWDETIRSTPFFDSLRRDKATTSGTMEWGTHGQKGITYEHRQPD